MKKRFVAALLSAAALTSVCVPSAYAASFDISDVQLEEELDKEAAFATDVDLTEESDKTATSGFSDYKIDKASGLTYRTYTDSKGTVSLYVYGSEQSNGNSKITSITIPSTIDGMKVTNIGDYAFEKYTALQTVVIPDTVEDIGIAAFGDCYSLKNITFSKNLNHLSVYAFRNCVSLTEVNLPDSVESIYTGAFYGCTNMTSFHIPASLDFGGDEIYLKGCPNLTKITFSSSVSLKLYLKSNSSIESHSLVYSALYIPATVKEITIDGGKLSKPTLTNLDGSIYADFVICGVEGSYAQTWAKKNGIDFYTVDLTQYDMDYDIVVWSSTLGDIDGNGSIDALDASAVLTAYAKAAVGKDNGLDSSQEKDADVNGDGSIDALDASAILSYYAYTATGGTDSLSVYLA